jgi:glycosyltransferase involved in cell wall biosynthesis
MESAPQNVGSHAISAAHQLRHAVETGAPAPPVPAELQPHQKRARAFRKAFGYYDIVQGYALDGILPLLAGKRAFACYEHGTLRDLPFHNDRRGRMCAYTYLNAPAVFITNTDCVAAANRLGIRPERQYPIPHAFDSDRVIAFRQANAETCFPHNDPVTFMCPTRHHWKHGSAAIGLKGNDVVIRAARRLADQGLEFKIIVVRWGQEVAESEHLMAELGVERYFEWIEPVPKDRLWRYYMSCNGVLDQFVIPAIGSVSFETLAFGRPLFTRIDDAVFADFFGETPPLLNVHTPKALADALAPLILDPSAYADLEKAAIQWVADRHSSERIIEIQLDAYEKLLADDGKGSPSEPAFRAVVG